MTAITFCYRIWQENQLVWVRGHTRIPAIKDTASIALRLQIFNAIVTAPMQLLKRNIALPGRLAP